MNKIAKIFTVPSSSDLKPNSMCVDSYGQFVLPGKLFQPASRDHCTQCVCINGKPENCLSLSCQPPDNCKKSSLIQKKGSCCEYICLNQEDDSDKNNKLYNKEYNHQVENTNNINTIDRNVKLNQHLNPESNLNTTINDKRLFNFDNKKNIKDEMLNTISEKKNYTSINDSDKMLLKNEKVSKNEKKNLNSFQNLGIGVGIGNGNSESQENQLELPKKQSQRINNLSNMHHLNHNKHHSTNSLHMENDHPKLVGRKYGIYNANVYNHNINNLSRNNFTQYSDEYPFVSLNDWMRLRNANRNYHPHNTGINLNYNNVGSSSWYKDHNLGLRLLTSTLMSFFILALLMFLIHRLRQRRLLVMIRRLYNQRDENNQPAQGNLPCFQNDLLARSSCFVEPPPPYIWKPLNNTNNLVAPGEAPPPYEFAASFSNPLLNINPTDTSNNQLQLNNGQNNSINHLNVNSLNQSSSTTNLISNNYFDPNFNQVQIHQQNQNISNVSVNTNNLNNFNVPYQNLNHLSQRNFNLDQQNIRSISTNLNSLTLDTNYFKTKNNSKKFKASKALNNDTNNASTSRFNNDVSNFENNIYANLSTFKQPKKITQEEENSVCRLVINDNSSFNQLPSYSKNQNNFNFYKNYLENQSYQSKNQQSSGFSLDKKEVGSHSKSAQNLSLRSKSQRCVVNIPNSQSVLKLASATNSVDNYKNNLNDLSPESSESPPPPAPPIRQVSLPAELRDEEQLKNKYSFNQQTLKNFDKLKNNYKLYSEDTSFQKTNFNPNQFKYSAYLSKLKEQNLDKAKLLLNENSNNSSEKIQNNVTSNFITVSSSYNLNLINQTSNEDESEKKVNKMQNFKENKDENIKPTTSNNSSNSCNNTTRIMINLK